MSVSDPNSVLSFGKENRKDEETQIALVWQHRPNRCWYFGALMKNTTAETYVIEKFREQ